MVPPDSSLFPSFTGASKGYIYIQVDTAGVNTLSNGLFADNQQRQLNLVDTASLMKGSHSLKFGVDYRRLFPVSNVGSYRRQWNPNSIDGLVSDQSNNGSISLTKPFRTSESRALI